MGTSVQPRRAAQSARSGEGHLTDADPRETKGYRSKDLRTQVYGSRCQPKGLEHVKEE